MATIKEHHTTIDGVTYTATTLPATQALVILPRLVALFGDGIVSLFMATGEDGMAELLENPQVLARVITEVATTAADPEGIFKGKGLLVLKEILPGVTADKVRIGGDVEVKGPVLEHFDDHFVMRLPHLVRVCVWVARLNFFAPTAASS